MPDSNETVRPAAEAIQPSVHPDVSPHVETEGDIKHLADIHAALREHGVKTTGELTPVSTEPQVLDHAQFEARRGTKATPQTKNTKGETDDSSRWNLQFEKKLKERSLRHAA